MRCSKCGADQLIITNTRNHEWGVKRVRVCLVCGCHIPTIEVSKITEEAIESLNKSQKKTRTRKETK